MCWQVNWLFNFLKTTLTVFSQNSRFKSMRTKILCTFLLAQAWIKPLSYGKPVICFEGLTTKIGSSQLGACGVLPGGKLLERARWCISSQLCPISVTAYLKRRWLLLSASTMPHAVSQYTWDFKQPSIITTCNFSSMLCCQWWQQHQSTPNQSQRSSARQQFAMLNMEAKPTPLHTKSSQKCLFVDSWMNIVGFCDWTLLVEYKRFPPLEKVCIFRSRCLNQVVEYFLPLHPKVCLKKKKKSKYIF